MQMKDGMEATVEQHEGGVSQEAADSFEVFSDNQESIYGQDGGDLDLLDYGFYDYDLYGSRADIAAFSARLFVRICLQCFALFSIAKLNQDWHILANIYEAYHSR